VLGKAMTGHECIRRPFRVRRCRESPYDERPHLPPCPAEHRLDCGARRVSRAWVVRRSDVIVRLT
jgi:hypothetical protein